MDAPLSPLDRVYAAPGAEPEAAEEKERAAKVEAARGVRTRSAKLLGLSVAAFGLSILLLGITSGRGSPAALVLLVAAALGVAGAGHSIIALVKGVSAAAGPGAAAWSITLAGANLFMTLLGLLTAWLSTMTFTRGRQIRSFGKILLPPVEARREAWTALAKTKELALDPATISLDGDTRAALAAQWRENGRTEHASVAAFARLTLDLMALGAPPELVAGANRDALDEIRHAELCFGLARALDGRSEGPGAFPAAARARALSGNRTMALAELAVDSLIDGALHEGVSARIVAKLARRCDDATIGSMMKEIAADEGRHARHGWDVVRWCLAEGGEPVARALAGAIRVLPEKMSSPMPDDARDGRWERFGIMGEALEEQEHLAARADVERRVNELVAAFTSPRAAA